MDMDTVGEIKKVELFVRSSCEIPSESRCKEFHFGCVLEL